MLQRVWGWRCGLLQVLVFLSSALAADGVYRLVPPKLYAVFTGDLEVTFEMPSNVSLPNAFVKLEGERPRSGPGPLTGSGQWTEVTTMGLPLGRKRGTVVAACGVVEYAGRYKVTMYMQLDGPVLAEATFITIWPSVRLHLPREHRALTQAVTLDIQSSATCASRLHREYLFVVLYFQRIEDSGESYARLSDAEVINVMNLTSIAKDKMKRVYPCELFDMDGSYQAVMKSSTGSILETSNVMSVAFPNSYLMSFGRTTSAFPCSDDLTAIYTHAPCAAPGADRVRLYELHKQAPGSAAAPLDRVYVTELTVDPDQTRIRFNCSLFNETAMGFCFVYVTVSKLGAVAEQTQLCLPAQPNAVIPQDGGWSAWTTWGACSTTCGTGTRSRFRMCNDPEPEHGGRYCEGQHVQMMHCQVDCPDAVPRTPLKSPEFDPACYCGCTQNAESGQIIASGRCKGLAVWIIKAPAEHHVTLTFRYFDLFYDKQWVKVRDGVAQNDELLYYSRDEAKPHDVTSSGDVMRVELMTDTLMTSPAQISVFPKNATLPIHVHGFIASYAVKAVDVAQLPPPLYRHVEQNVMESNITIVGIVVCAVVVVVLIIFAIVQRRYWPRVPKYSIAASSEASPAHMAHSSSAQSSQPSSPGPQVHVDMDIPLTGNNSKRKNSGQRTQSRTPSVSSTCSAGLKKMRSRAENSTGGGVNDRDTPGAMGGAGVGPSSPKPHPRDYSPMSPYSANASPEDHVHDSNFFRASPILRQVAPRSPKVHPHRVKASPVGTPSSPQPSPTITKHEMLTRKRQERKLSTPAGDGGEREVTGSSGSCSTSKTSATLTTTATITRAEINPPPKSKPSDPTRLTSEPVSISRTKRKSPADRTPEQEEIPLIDSVEDLSSTLKADSRQSPACEETSFILSKSKARRPTSLTETYSLESIETKGSKSRTPRTPVDAKKPSAMEERQTLLPKPDGQSPKSPRGEPVLLEKDSESKVSSPSRFSSPSKSSISSKSNKTMSPTHSIATPELEYDDFVMDDPLSYFEYEETSKLTWHGTEKLGRSHKHE